MKLFKNFSILTVVAIYLLILVGGIVRSTGSGMGCPDWPKCFGQWIPPTQESELPADYRDVYKQKRMAKNERFAKLLNKLGFDDMSFRITKDPLVLIEEPFNVTKTWIEYLNRVLGVLIGFFIFLAFIFSLPYRKTDKTVVVLTFAAFIMVGLEGFIGSIVVSTNLLPALISVHMLLAIAIVLVLIYALARAFYQGTITNKVATKLENNYILQNNLSNNFINNLLIISLITSIIQILLGTQIREAIDLIASTIADRNLWIDNLGLSFYVHRSFSLVILALHSYLAYTLFKQAANNYEIIKAEKLKFWAYILVAFIGIEILTGAIMAYFAVPALLQPVHLTLATVIVGVQFWVYLLVNEQKWVVKAI